jgi:predicted amino acid-binding ACT domain protein
MSAVFSMNVTGITQSVVRAAFTTGFLIAAPQVADAKTQFTSADLAAVELEENEVSAEMLAAKFTLSDVLPWFEEVRSQAAEALLEM